jgi:hypothetical protein
MVILRSGSGDRYLLQAAGHVDRTVRASNPAYVDEVTTASLCSDVQLNIRLTPINVRLEGTVFDTTSGFAPLDGATVEIVSGSGAGQKALTDAIGHYALSGLYGLVVVRASKSGYTSEERTINISDPVSFWNFGLRRPSRMAASALPETPEITGCELIGRDDRMRSPSRAAR